jgi:phospholipid/cholesterol/gamma-HCH transport system permease protein
VLVLYELKQVLNLTPECFRVIHPPERFAKTLPMINLDFDQRCPLASRRTGKNYIIQLGETTINSLVGLKFVVSFVGAIFLAALQILKKPKSLRFDDVVWHMKTTGIDALPVVALIGFLLGLIMAFVSSLQLKQFGANIYVASLVAMAMVSELGPIMTAIIVAGRSGSAYAAEISTMKISEEIDALFTMGFDPTIFLVIPRLIAAFVVIPILTIFANIFAIAGGLVIGVTMLNLTVASYINQTMDTLTLFEFLWGLSKSLVFAVLIAGVGCLRGFQARGGASAVGNAATSAVVTSIFLIILFDSMFAVIRSYWG